METSKARDRRERENFFSLHTTGLGLDIGPGRDPITRDCDTFDLAEPEAGRVYTWGANYCGDAHTLDSITQVYDWVSASHILEHLTNPSKAIARWYDVVRPGGYLILSVPHRDLYEKKLELPSRWNKDHKSFWLPFDTEPPCTIGLKPFLETNLPDAQILSITVQDAGHTITDPAMHSNGEYSIEAIIRKPLAA